MNPRLLAVLSMLAMPIASIATADNPVVFFLGEAQFFNGDYVKIDSVTSTGDAFEVGATITVAGTYTLNSAEHARLCFYTTQSVKPGDKAVASPELKSQRLDAKRGTHPFTLSKVVTGDGGPHLTFYDSDSAFGGVYFGDESNVWMKKGWSYDAPSSVPAAPSKGK
ncbi:hypothetical protein [Rhodopirellula baltica]|nr:hypothetical protein [Rhodopirellula baltica]